jgi:DNA mismatch repair ATPase MutS
MRVINEDDGDLQFTYEFVDGSCTHSYANFTALKMGIKKSVSERAEEVSKQYMFQNLVYCKFTLD